MIMTRLNGERLLKYLQYLFRAKHFGGHGIHSPFIYELATKVLFTKDLNSDYKHIKAYKKSLLDNKQTVFFQDPGAGSQQESSKTKRIKDIAYNSSVRNKYGKVLSRLVAFYSPNVVLELGTSLGVSALYLSKMLNDRARFYTIEGVEEIYKITKKHLGGQDAKNIHLINGLFDDVLPSLLNDIDTLDFVFFDGNHTKTATLRYFEICLEKINNNTIFVFDDIHWSDGMEEAWEQIKEHQTTRVCIDLFQLGIVFFRKELSVQNYTILF